MLLILQIAAGIFVAAFLLALAGPILRALGRIAGFVALLALAMATVYGLVSAVEWIAANPALAKRRAISIGGDVAAVIALAGIFAALLVAQNREARASVAAWLRRTLDAISAERHRH